MSDIRQSHRPLWQVAQDFIFVLFDLFGPPEAIAARHTLVREQWALLAKWLRAGEALMRQLLLVEAAALPKPNAQPPRAKRTRKRRVFEFSAEAPETWRVSFRCFADSPSTSSKQRIHRRQPELVEGGKDAGRFHAAWPLAERAEALLRVFNNPLPYALRLARRLFAAPDRARALMKHDAETPSLVGAVSFANVRVAAAEALSALDTS